MTLKYMQGFETMRDNSDMVAQGWAQQTTRIPCGFPTSITAVNGTSLKIFSSYSTQTVAPGTSGEVAPGYFNTGITVNQAWLAGGFTLGFGAKFNSGVIASYGAGATVTTNGFNNAQACFDGTKYWALRFISGIGASVCYSTDLVNWTVSPSQPTTNMDSFASISYVGNNTIVVIRTTLGTSSLTVWYSNNQGNSWGSQVVGTFAGTGPLLGIAAATGNSTYPHLVLGGITIGGNGYSTLYVGTLGGTMANVKTASSVSVYGVSQVKNIGGLICVLAGMVNGVPVQMYTATANNPALNTPAAWSTMTSSTTTLALTDVAYHAPSNLWVFSAVQGIYTLPNTGASGTPVAPSGTVAPTLRYSTVAMSNVNVVGTTLVAVGTQGHIVTSTDGITWTETGGHLLPVGVNSMDWRSVIYDGSQYVLFSDSSYSGMIAVTPDLQTNYAAKYIMDNAEQANSTNNLGRAGITTAVAAPAANGTFTAGGYFSTFYVQAASGGNRTVQLGVQGTATYDSTFSVSTASLYHFYEIVGRAATTANTFFYDVYVDGIKVSTGTTARTLAAAADTTTLMLISLDRYGAFTAFDDIYLTLNDGVANTLQGPLGIINIIAQRPTTDVQVQWVKTGGGSTNASAVNQTALSSMSGQYVSSANAGDKDVYASSEAIPAGFTAKAQMVEAYFTKTSTTAPSVNVGIKSGSAEADSPNVTVSSANAVYTALVSDVNPNGNVGWNNASINSSNFVINHVT